MMPTPAATEFVVTDAYPNPYPVCLDDADVRADRERLLLASTEYGYVGTRVTAVPERGDR